MNIYIYFENNHNERSNKSMFAYSSLIVFIYTYT